MKPSIQSLLKGSIISFFLIGCLEVVAQKPLQSLVEHTEFIKGREKYLETPFATTGSRLYMVGSQNGQFPDIGWHVEGEMGGIWDHPIKLMDGFTASVTIAGKRVCLEKATEFINYPFANKHIYSNISEGLDIERFQFVPDDKEGMMVEYTLINKSNAPRTITFEWTAHTDLRPVWLGERTNMIDGADEVKWDETNNTWIAKDANNSWFVIFGSGAVPVQHHQDKTCDFVSRGQTAQASLVYSVTIPAWGKSQLPIAISGSSQSEQSAKTSYDDIIKNAYDHLKSKKQRYDQLTRIAALTIPDKNIEQAYRWLRYNTDWLKRNVPGIGTGVTGGLPDYPWWFSNDGTYTLSALIATGDKQTVYDGTELLYSVSEKENGNGRIIHEVSTNGSVYNKGNLNEVPQFAILICEIYRWTGDRKFLQRYFPTLKKGMQWLWDENDADKNLVADGYGNMEIHGLKSEMIDVAVYSQRACEDISFLAKELGDTAVANDYRRKAEVLKQKINADFWVSESNSYADFIGSKEEALALIKDAMIRADTLKKPWAVAELKATENEIMKLPANTRKGFVLYHNWVVNTPMETGVADPEKARLALATARKFTNPFGAFVTGIDRDETAGNDATDFALKSKHFTYTGAVMTIPTAVSVIGEAKYGNLDESLKYLSRMNKTFSYASPGSMYEISPDYGMFVQGWNIYGYAVPIIKQYFGLHPDAAHKMITLQPAMPKAWDNAMIDNLPVGDNVLTIKYDFPPNGLNLRVSQTQKYKIILMLPKGKYMTWTVNDKVVSVTSNDTHDFVEINGRNIVVSLK